MNTTAITVATNVSMHTILGILINAFDTSAIAYWLRRAQSYDPEFDDAEDEAASKLYGKPGTNHEVVWPEGVDEDSFDPATLDWMPKDELPWTARTLYFAPFLAGGSVILYVDPSDAPGGVDRVVLDLAAIKRGVEAMHDKAHRHFFDMVEGDDDAVTADVLVQCCVFGDVVY